ncbi:DUF1127 domain-containing protein [Bradyrhizobium commune]|uniref:DUF1127 domain-containing protein n=1 Tax=Bradyrhizobium commune TaxID=83627 RepID=A0A7S9H1T1_9BRAD|nr:DUF1127 domain-containing protein [Bradyrhizobium commune]QPF93958.1 DUF1127 domain-containing protein [Bradyrhizobium commune]
MPPQLTDVSPGIEGEAARRGLNISIVQAKDAIDQALAARLKASATALDDALSDKDAAGPAALGVVGLLKQYWLAFRGLRSRPRVNLQDLSDRELMDIGLTRGEIDYASPQRAIDKLRDRATDPWSRGVI